MSIILNDNFSTEFNKPLDNRYGPFVDVATALSELPSYRRFIGLTVAIGSNPTIEYWFNDGILDTDFVQKIPVVNYPVTSVNGKTGDVVLNKADIGLGNVDNTSDINKPISTLVQNALNLKEGTITAGTTAQYWRGDKTFQTLDKTAVGLSNVDNTSDVNKPISTATQTALNGKQATISLTTTGNSGASTFAANVLNIPNYSLSGLGGQPLNANLTSISALTYASTSFVKMTAAGTFALDTNTYLTAESDTLASVTGRGNTTATTLIYSGTTEGIRPNTDSTGTIGASNFRFLSSYTRSISAVNNSLDIIGSNINLNDSSNNVKLKLFGSTGNVTLQNGGTFTDAGFRLDVNGTARIQNQLTTTGSITAASAIARGVYMNQTLVAAANNDVLVGLDIQPTFTTGAFTGTIYSAIRHTGNIITSVDNTYSLGLGTNGYSLVWSRTFRSNNTLTLQGQTDIVFSNTTLIAAKIMTTTGNLILQNGGTFTDAGFRLDVVGADSRFNGIRAGLGAGQVAGNTVFGDGALGSNSIGVDITAIGYQALSVNTANNNTAVGHWALKTNTTGVGNTAVGRDVMVANGTGSYNSIVGVAGISGNTSGSNNSGIGFNIQNNNFSGSVILGSGATATANNQFVVGSLTVNAGAVTTATAVQTKTWDVIINGVAQKILLA